jgi:hypothetical protein
MSEHTSVCPEVTSPVATPEPAPLFEQSEEPILQASSLRRSNGLKILNQGFRKKSCADKNCLACTVTPPTLSPTLIKNLGVTFAKMSPDELSSEALQARTKSKGKKTLQSKPNPPTNQTRGKKNSKETGPSKSVPDDTPRKKPKK